MKLIRIAFSNEDGAARRVILADPNQINIMGTEYVHGKQVTPSGFLVTAPWGYTHRHPEGDGMVWRMIPMDSISYMTPLTHPKERA